MDSNAQESTAKQQINQGNSAEDKLKSVFVLQIGLGILILLVVFGVLNYFNILPLSTLYPNQLGRLPKAESKKPAENNTITPYEASKEQKEKYNSYSNANLEKNAVPATDLQDASKAAEYITEGIFSGYKNDSITLTTANGVMDFNTDSNTLFYSENNLSNSSDTSYDSNTKEGVEMKENIGKLVQINYNISESSLNQAKKVYLLKKSVN